MYYYRHGEVIFASLLPDLPLEPAKRPSAGTPSLFLIDRDPIRSRSSFCVSDPRQLTAETEDVTWLCLLYTSPSPRDRTRSRMPSSA